MLWLTLWQLKSSKWEVRAEAAARLGASHMRRAVPALIRALEDENDTVRLAAINALAAIRHPASADPLAKTLAGLASRSKGASAGKGGSARGAEYEALAAALGALGSAAAPPLLGLLNSEEQETRRWVAHALGIARDARSLVPLIQRLADNRSDVRKEAALALGEIRDPSALDPLIQSLAHRDSETRRAAALALGTIGEARAVGALCAAAEDPNEPVQLAVVEALRKIGSLQAGAGLRAIIDAGRKNVREAAATALNSLRFSPASAEERATAAVLLDDFAAAVREAGPAVGVLITTLGSKDERRRRRAAEALGLLRPTAAIAPLLRALKDNHATVQEAAARALAAIGSPAVEALFGMLAHPDATVQRLAARTLGEIGDARAAVPLAGILEENRTITNEYPEALDVAREAAAALEGLLVRASSAISAEDLQQAAAVPDAVHRSAAPASGAPAVDCSRIRSLAAQELQHRQAGP